MEETTSPNLTLLEKEIRSIVESNSLMIQQIESFKKNQSKVVKIYNVIALKDSSTIIEPLSVDSKKIKEEISVEEFVNKWTPSFSIEKLEEIDPDHLLYVYVENKDLMNMKCNNFEDLIRINQQISVATKYLTLLREGPSYAFGLKFKKNFEIIGNLLKSIISDIKMEENNCNDNISNEIEERIEEINKLFQIIFKSHNVFNNEPFNIKIETKILTEFMIICLGKMFINKKKNFKLIHDNTRGVQAVHFDTAVKNKGPTLILIKNNLNFIFGAYVVDRWGAPGGWIVGSKETFLFTFGVESNINPIKLLHAGGGKGINITNCGLHLGTDLDAFCSNSCTPQVYTQIAPGYSVVPVTNTLLAGAQTWTPKIMEVFEEIN